MRVWRLCLVTAAIAAAPAAASADVVVEGQVQYVGVHPIAASPDEGVCYIEVPHVHVYAPPKKARVLYRTFDDHHHFVADPTAFGYDGPKHSYYGHHPIPIDVTVGLEPAYVEGQALEHCYLDGPHYHHWAPPPGITFTAKADANWYIGEFGPDYRKHRRRYARVNAFYEPIVYVRPEVVVEEPPVGYVGPFVDVHVTGGAVVEGPAVRGGAAVDIHVPTPSVSVEVGLPSVRIGGGVHHHRHRKHKKFKKHKRYKKHRKRHRGWR